MSSAQRGLLYSAAVAIARRRCVAAAQQAPAPIAPKPLAGARAIR
jgi:hypothetical protein